MVPAWNASRCQDNDGRWRKFKRKFKLVRFIITVPTFGIGGMSSHALNVSTALRKRGHWTCALVADPYGQLYADFGERFDRVITVRRGWETRGKYLRRVRDHLLALSADVLINNQVAFVQAALPWMPPSLVRLSVLHNIVPDEILSGTANQSHLDWIIAVSQNVADAASPRVTGSKLVVIPVGVEQTADFRLGRSETGTLRLVYAGRLSRTQKNLPTLESVVAELYRRKLDFDLTIIGDGDYRAGMEEQIARQPFAKQVSFTGVLPPCRIVARLAECDVFLLTSTYEGTPHALLEAMAAGAVPVCSSIKGSTDCLVRHGETGYLCGTFAVQDYVLAIERLAREPATRRRLSAAAQNFVRTEFSMDLITEKYLKLIAARRDRPVPDRRNANEAGMAITPELLPLCPGFPRQVRRLGGDLFRAWFRGVRPVKLPGLE
jgi:glycosyltransferase involved in cell wall biosynthesis